jgi:flavin-dependent dehydrogenase
MLDINAHPRTAPGETLHPGIEPILNQLGIAQAVEEAGFHRHTGVWMEDAGERRFVPYGEDHRGPWRGFQVDRRIFGQILRRAAVDGGVTLIPDGRAGKVLMSGERVTGIEVADGRRYLSHWTIDATGRSAWLARKLGLEVVVRSQPLRVRFGWRRGNLKDLDGQPLFSFHEDGWEWQAPLGEGRVAWVKLRVGDPANPAEAGVDVTWRYRPDCAGPGYFLIGDAAAMLDPSSSHGVLRSLMSGILCSHLIAGCRQPAVEEAGATAAYRAWLLEQFAHDEQRLLRHYGRARLGQRAPLGDASHPGFDLQPRSGLSRLK